MICIDPKCFSVVLCCWNAALGHWATIFYGQGVEIFKTKDKRVIALEENLILNQQSAEVNRRLNIYFKFLDLNQDDSFAMMNLNQFWPASYSLSGGETQEALDQNKSQSSCQKHRKKWLESNLPTCHQLLLSSFLELVRQHVLLIWSLSPWTQQKWDFRWGLTKIYINIIIIYKLYMQKG